MPRRSERAAAAEVFSAESCTRTGITEPTKSCQTVLSELKSEMTNLGKEAPGHILAQQAGARGEEEVKVNPEEILEGKAACTQLMLLLFVTCSFPSKCLLSSSLCNVLEGCGRAEELFEIDQVLGAPQQGFRSCWCWERREHLIYSCCQIPVRGRAEVLLGRGCAPRWLQFCWLLDKLR